ncbi:uncharacterized protein JCM6883_005973 [Sporobolomyces salmoneus]|uniref:uncharacterized protein n=1 Tax=Sporobolomyces salmoneus TaxID=183962 RepID=UPI00317A1669
MSLNGAQTPEEVEELLKASLRLLPNTTNPWVYFQSTAFLLLNNPAPAAFSPLLITASSLLSVATLLYITGLVVRWRKGTLWFVRVVRVGQERFILPHYVVSYVSLMTIFNLCLQSFLWIVWFRIVKGITTRSQFLSNSLPWIPGVLSVCCAVHSLTVTWVLHRRAYHNGSEPWYTSAKFTNSLGVVLPMAALGTLLPYGILASNNLQYSQESSAKLYNVLESGARTWTPGSPIDLGRIHDTSVLVIDVARNLGDYGTTYELFFSILAGWCGFLGLTFVGVASLYLRDLKRSIRSMQGRTRTGVETFAKTYRWLVLVTIGLGFSCIALAVNVSWIAATLQRILRDGTTNAIAIIIPLFTVAVLGIPVSIIILHNALSTPSARSLASSTIPHSNPSGSTLTSKQQQQQQQENLDHIYTTQFDLVAALPLDRFAFLSSGNLEGGARADGTIPPDGVPFGSLELQPTPTSHSRGANKLDGIVVNRCEETVTVVALPNGEVETEMGHWQQIDDDEDDKKW